MTQFETIINSGIITIPKQYITTVPTAARVTVAPVNEQNIRMGKKSKVGEISSNEFIALRLIQATGVSIGRKQMSDTRVFCVRGTVLLTVY
jgi:hypothetical protein